MPTFVPAEQVTLTLESGLPVISLSGVAVTDADANGWSLLNRATLVVVDGPGDEGFLISRFGGDRADIAPADWDDAVRAEGGAWVSLVGTDIRFHVPDLDAEAHA